MKKRRIHIVLATTLFGVLLWLTVTLRDQYQTTVSVPLVIENVPEGWAINTPLPRALHLKLRGDGWRLATLLIGPELRVVIPLHTLPPGNRPITLNDIADGLTLRPGIQLVDFKPESLFIGLDRYVQKRVRVEMNYAVSFRDGYGQVGTTSVEPESVTISGAASVLQAFTSWKTGQGSFQDLKTPVETDVPLAASSIYQISVAPSSVRIRISVQPFAEKAFYGLPVDMLAMPSNREVILIPPKIDVVVRGGIRQLAGLTDADFRVSVNYRTILTDTTGMADMEIVAPAGVQIVSRRPERLQYVVRRRL